MYMHASKHTCLHHAHSQFNIDKHKATNNYDKCINVCFACVCMCVWCACQGCTCACVCLCMPICVCVCVECLCMLVCLCACACVSLCVCVCSCSKLAALLVANVKHLQLLQVQKLLTKDKSWQHADLHQKGHKLANSLSHNQSSSVTNCKLCNSLCYSMQACFTGGLSDMYLSDKHCFTNMNLSMLLNTNLSTA